MRASCSRGGRPPARADANPFGRYNASRDHFPALDAALCSESSAGRFSRSKSRDRKLEGTGGRLSRSPQDRDLSGGRSCASSSSQNFSVDLSIGARAALTEHRWHVNKFGIDGTPDSSVLLTSSPNDGLWDRMMDGDCSQASWLSSAVDKSKTLSADGSTNSRHPDESRLSAGHDTSDFFNSSRVNGLMTPERNKPKVDEASRLALLGEGGVTERRHYENSYAESSADSTPGSMDHDTEGMASLFDAAVRFGGDYEQDSASGSPLMSDSASAGSEEGSTTINDLIGVLSWEKNRCWLRRPPSILAFQEEEHCIELIANISDILPSDKNNESYDGEKLQLQENFSSKYESPPVMKVEYPREGKENVDFASPAMSPIASRAGSMVAKTISEPGHKAKAAHRLPLSTLPKPPIEKNPLSMDPNAMGNTPQCIKDSPTSPISAFCESENDCEIWPPNKRAPEKEKKKVYNATPKRAIMSLKERYCQPERFEDGFNSPQFTSVRFHGAITNAFSNNHDQGLRSASKSLMS